MKKVYIESQNGFIGLIPDDIDNCIIMNLYNKDFDFIRSIHQISNEEYIHKIKELLEK